MMKHDALPADLVTLFSRSPELPTPLPADPFPLFAAWFADEKQSARTPNPDAMSLATIDADGSPSVRIVLCRGIDAARGSVTFFTNYDGRKGQALHAHPRAALCFHWDDSDRQVRLEGAVTRCTPAESDAYFYSRRWESRLSAWTSHQSQPTAGRAALLAQMQEVIRELGLDPKTLVAQGERAPIPRPAHWGGFRFHAHRVELWLGGHGRLHDRAAWTRPVVVAPSLAQDSPPPEFGAWTNSRLQP